LGLAFGKNLSKEDIQEITHGNPSPVMDNIKEILANNFYHSSNAYSDQNTRNNHVNFYKSNLN
jgi:hypothetical protein